MRKIYQLKSLNSKQMQFMKDIMDGTPVGENETAGKVSLFDDKQAQYMPWELHNESVHIWTLPGLERFQVFRSECLVQFILMPEKGSRLPEIGTPRIKMFAHVSHSKTSLAYIIPCVIADILCADRLQIFQDDVLCNIKVSNTIMYPPNLINVHSYGFGYTMDGLLPGTAVFFRFEEGLKKTQLSLDEPPMNVIGFNIVSKNDTFCANIHISPIFIDGYLADV